MNKLVVGIFFEEDEAEEAAADDGDTWHEEAAGVLHAGVADALGRAVRYLQQEIKMWRHYCLQLWKDYQTTKLK